MTFAFPWMLFLLPLALAALRTRPHAAIPVSGLAVWRGVPPSPRLYWLRRLRPLRAVALALLIAASAGPQMERQVGEETRQGVAIQLLIDISSSMDQSLAAGADMQISKLEAVKRVVEQFIRHSSSSFGIEPNYHDCPIGKVPVAKTSNSNFSRQKPGASSIFQDTPAQNHSY